jgi:hypothetical protein
MLYFDVKRFYLELVMKRSSLTLLFIVLLPWFGIAFAGDWNLVKNVKRLEQVAPDYKEDTAIDKKFLEVLDLTEKTKKDGEIYEEAKRITTIPALIQSKYMDSFQYYMLVKATLAAKAGSSEPDFWLNLLKANNKSPHLLAAWLVHLKYLPKHSPDMRRDAQVLVDWIKAQKPEFKVRAPEYAGNILTGYKPRVDFFEGDYPKLYSLSYYKATVTPPAGFFEEDTYVNVLDRIKEGREDILSEMSEIYRKSGKRKEASEIQFQLATLKIKNKDFKTAKSVLDDAVKLNPDNSAAIKERDRIKLELTLQSLAPAAPVANEPAATLEKSADTVPVTEIEGNSK